MRSFTTVIVLGVLAAAFVLSPTVLLGAGESTLAVRIDSRQLAVHGSPTALGVTPQLDLDYGSYRWLTLSSEELARLHQAGVEVTPQPDAFVVQVPGYRFDPLRDGEPNLTGPWVAHATHQPALRLVQLIGPAKQDWLSDMAAVGVRVLQYYPSHAFLVWADGLQVQQLSTMPHTRWLGDFQPAYKLGDHLDLAALSEPTTVIYVDAGDAPSTVGALASLGTVLSDRKAQPDGALRRAKVLLDATGVQAAARLTEVLWMAPAPPGVQLEDEMSSQIVAGNYPAGVPEVGYFQHLTDLGYDGSGVTWAIVDTGVDYDHPDLGSRITGGFSVPGTACNTPPGNDCSSGSRGHGTHVAGIVGADASAGFADGNGFLYGLGVAPEVNFFAVNIFGSDFPFEDFTKETVLAGASGSNNSWTTGEGTAHGYQDSERTYDFIVRDGNFDTPAHEPHIVVFSAGNSGSGSMTLTAPKEAKNVIVTGGTQNYRTTSNIDAMYNSSSRGPAVDGRYVPTIVAPGQTIASTANDGGGSCSNGIGGTNGLYAFCTGTSMASPQTAGALALATQWWNDLHGVDPSPAMAKSLLVISSVDITGAADPVPNFDEGWGRIQVTDLIAPAVERIYVDQTHVFDDSGETWVLNTTVADPSEPLKVSVAWTDAPGALGANPALVNDLDLEVVVDGTTYLGNDFSGGVSTTGGTSDVLNNLENVFVPGASGSVTVTVRATNLAGDGIPSQGDVTDQDFALICHNCVDSSLFTDGFESGDVAAWSNSSL